MLDGLRQGLVRHRSRLAACAIILTLAGCSRTAFKGWQRETFGPVRVEAGDGITLSSATGPGGMFFRSVLLKDTSYRLTIAGQSRSGRATVRVTLDQSTPQWLPAPDGQTVVAFTGSQSVEVVVYGDTPYGYHLQNLTLEACDHCVPPSVFGGWQLEPYGAVGWTPNAGSVRLSSAATQGGIFFRRQLDPAKTYRLQLDGHAVSGKTTVRVTIGQSGPKWLPAPDGAKHLTVSASDSIEALIYGDAAYAYRLDTIAIEECAACLADRQFARLVVAEIPTLQGLLDRDRKAAARALLDWTAHVVAFGDGIEAATSWELDMSAAEVYQELWSTHAAGAACGGFADFFAKVLRLFGFDAFTMNIGYAGTALTHVTTVAVIDGEFYLLDPTLNGVYIDPRSGDLARLEPLLNKPASGDADYVFRTSPIARDVVLAADDGTAARLLSTFGVSIADCEPVRDRATGRVRHVCAHVPYDPRESQALWREQLESLHLQWDHDMIRSLMRHCVLSLSATKPAIRQRFLDQLSSHGIPFGSP